MATPKPYELGPALGLNNRLAVSELRVTDRGRPVGSYLADAMNVTIDDAGNCSRAPGTTKVGTLTAGRALLGDGASTYLVDGTSLEKITAFDPLATSPVETVGAGDIRWTLVNGEIVLTDAVDIFAISATGAARRVSIPAPASLSVAATAGVLPAGRYQCAITLFIGAVEGPASDVQHVELTSTGGITFTLPSVGSDITHIGIYLSVQDGSVPQLHSVISPTGSVTVTTLPTLRACKTLERATMPGGSDIAFSGGRLLTAFSNALFVSDAYSFGILSATQGYVLFSKDISVIAAMETGVYVVADQTYWLTGVGTDAMTMTTVLPYGGVANTASLHPDKVAVSWMSHKGLVVGDKSGQVRNVQEDALALELDGSGAALFMDAPDRYVVSNG